MPTAFAPGRVNLMGEHVDYHGLPVLPMALTQGIRIRFRPTDDGTIRLSNPDPRWGDRSFLLDENQRPGPDGDWGNYAMAAAVALAREFGARTGIAGTVRSDLPPAAGLSSSSALVVAVATALLHASGLEVDRLRLAQVLAEGERFVGTAGGGMDQAASICGRVGHALRIGFSPLSVRPVPFPGDWRVLVAHSGVSAEKSGGARAAYNARRSETTGALRSAAEALGLPGAHPMELLAVRDRGAVLDALALREGDGAAWAVHVVEEYQRVSAATDALSRADLARFGELLNASHVSLRDIYQVSHPALDVLVGAARDAGAAGARLTGAGFGGCMLAVCSARDAASVRAALVQAQATLDPVPEVAPFVASPGAGAEILD